ncbi:MAG: stage V sporulation protein AC [Angelakisella sp.]
MGLTPKDYEKMSQKASPPTKSYKNLPMAFIVGGLICTLGQGLGNLYLSWGLEKDVATGFASVTLIFLAVLLTGLNVFDNIARHAGAGTLVPITGFANAMSSAAVEFRSEGLIMGLGAKLFIIVGPVLVYGLSAAVIYGILFYIVGR